MTEPQEITEQKPTEIPILLKFHPSEYTSEKVWNVESERPTEVRILRVNRRSQAHLLDVTTIEKLRVFLMRYGLTTTEEKIVETLNEAIKKYGVSNDIWLNCTRVNYSIHGLCKHFGIEDKLLIQNKSESNLAESGMFTIKRKLLNQYWTDIGSPLRFIKSYTIRKPIT